MKCTHFSIVIGTVSHVPWISHFTLAGDMERNVLHQSDVIQRWTSGQAIFNVFDCEQTIFTFRGLAVSEQNSASRLLHLLTAIDNNNNAL